MSKKISPILLLLFFQLFINAAPQSIPLPRLMEIKQNIYRFHFDSAQIRIKNELKKRPRDLSLNFYDAFIDFMGFSQDVTKTYLEPKMLSKIEISISIADSILEDDPDNSSALYYKALTLGLKGLYHVVRDEYISAYWYGGDGIKMLEEVVKKNPGYSDAYLGLGLFHYYIDLMPGLVKFFASILGYEGSREEGLKEIEFAAKEGKSFKVEARFALGALNYFVENDMNTGLYWFGLLEKDYPNNPLLNLMYGIYFRRKNDFAKSKFYTRKVLNPNQYGKFGSLLHGAYYNYGQIYFVENKFDSAYAVFQEVDRVPTRKSTYFRATIKFWLGYLSELSGDRKKAEKFYRLVSDNKITKRWYDYVKSLKKMALSSREKELIILHNRLKLNLADSASGFIEENKRKADNFNWREKGRFYQLYGEYLYHRGDYPGALEKLKISRTAFAEGDFEPMIANVDLDVLNFALQNRDIKVAEQAYDNAADYDERYFQIKLRKKWSLLEKLKEGEDF